MTPEILLNGNVELYAGDMLAVLPTLPANSVDSVVCDPPYHLTSIVKRFGAENAAPAKGNQAFVRASRGFMGKQWDGGDIAFQPDTWLAVLRVLKPGAHLVAFSGTRTYHRMACAIEDAGFEVRDQIEFDHDTETEYVAFEGSLNDEQRSQFKKLFRESTPGRLAWKFGSGFPKSLNVSRSISERCMCGVRDRAPIQVAGAARAILQQEMRGEGQASASDTADVRSLQQHFSADEPLSGCEQEDLLAQVPWGSDCAPEAWQNHAAREMHGQTPSDVRGLRKGILAERQVDRQGDATSVFEKVQRGVSRAGVGEARPQGQQGPHARELRAGSSEDDGAAQSRMEGRDDLSETPWQLCEREIHSMSSGVPDDGANGRLCDGAPAGDGGMARSSASAGGMCSPQRPSTVEQRADEFGTLAVQPQPQKRGAWDHCGWCGKPIVPDGLGSALKPACEPIVLARKPLSEKTVAANVLKWGTGAINIDGCRVATAPDDEIFAKNPHTHGGFGHANAQVYGDGKGSDYKPQNGRWPANVIHDGSDEVVGAFPETATGFRPNQSSAEWDTENGTYKGGIGKVQGVKPYADSGSAARFFYSSKADSDDRLGSRHPTVKPVDLMQWLVRLVTPKGGTCLDPFAGTGTTGEAAFREGCKAILIEREEEYQEDIRRRMRLAFSGQGERKRESVKARKSKTDHGPLFDSPMTDDGTSKHSLSLEPNTLADTQKGRPGDSQQSFTPTSVEDSGGNGTPGRPSLEGEPASVVVTGVGSLSSSGVFV